MSLELYPHLIFWNDKQYLSVKNLMLRVSNEDSTFYDSYNLYRGGDPVGRMGVYFADRAALDLGPIVQDVMAHHRATHPGFLNYYNMEQDKVDEHKAKLKIWRANLRRDLRVVIEPLLPCSYEEQLED